VIVLVSRRVGGATTVGRPPPRPWRLERYLPRALEKLFSMPVMDSP